MFCPKCATQNLEGASFCRTCGANISLVPQALTGKLEQAPAEDGAACVPGRRWNREATLDSAFKSIFVGFAFLVIAIALSRTIGQVWWFWLLIPAFSLMGKGVGGYIRVREKEKRASLAPPPIQRTFGQPVNTNVLMPPAPSVTESTTRHLNMNERK